MTAIKIVCPLCCAEKNKPLLNLKLFCLARCQRCDLLFLNPRPHKKDLWKFYLSNYYIKGGLIKRLLERRLTKAINLRRRLLVYQYKKGGKILDLGCGGGEFLNSFNKKWQKFGVEPSVFASKIAAAKKHLEVRNQELLTCHFPDSYFDIVTAWHVLEHLYNPKETLREMRRILKDDGVFLLSTPNTDSLGFKLAKESWFHLDAPRHLSLFNRLALKKILTSSRFRILKTSFPVLEYPLDLFHSISKAKLKNQFLRGVFTAPLFILLITLKPFLCLLGIGETMEVISVKTKKDS